MNSLEAKKRALVAESEVFRETLKLELHNMRLYGVRTRQKLSSFASPNKLLMFAAPFAGFLFRRKRSSLIRRFAMGLLSYQFTNRLLPLLTAFISANRRGSPMESAEESIQSEKRYSP
jgi:hypothetical protein